MPCRVAWPGQGLAFAGGGFGFTTFNDDLFGMPSAGLANGWHHVVAQFTNGDTGAGVLYVDGVRRDLSWRSGSPSADRAYAGSTLRLGGQSGSAARPFLGMLDEVVVFAGALSPARIAALHARSAPCAAFGIEIIAPSAVVGVPATLELVGMAIDDSAAVANFDVLADGVKIGNGSPSFNRVVWPNVPAGTHTITAVARDIDGNVASARPVTITVEAGSTAGEALPEVWLTAPAPGSVYATPTPVRLEAIAAETGGSIAQVEFLSGATVIGTATSAPFSMDWSGVPPGTYSLRARAVDSRGRAAVSTAVDVIVRASGIAITSPARDAQFTIGDSVTLRAEGIAPAAVARVEFRMDGTVIGMATWSAQPATDGVASLTWQATPAGVHALTAIFVMRNGTTLASAPITISVQDVVVTPPPEPPVTPPAASVTVAAGVDGSTIADDTLSFAGLVQGVANAAVLVNGRPVLLDTGGMVLRGPRGARAGRQCHQRQRDHARIRSDRAVAPSDECRRAAVRRYARQRRRTGTSDSQRHGRQSG